jgi:hypothetical protein
LRGDVDAWEADFDEGLDWLLNGFAASLGPDSSPDITLRVQVLLLG